MSLITLLSAIEKGFTPIPRPLPLGAHKEIYACLDSRTKRMYPTICREFNTYKTLDERADRIEEYIRENYKILGETSSKIDVKRFLFSLRGVAGSGEQHTERWHDLLNATLANCLSDFGFTQFFIEGTQRDLEKCKNTETYLFSYLKPKVAAAVKTWDLNMEEDQQACKKWKESFSLVGRKVTLMQKFFRLYSKEKWSWEDFDAFLLAAGTLEMAQGFWDVLFPQVWSRYFPTIPPSVVSVMASHPKSKELVAEIVKIAAISLIRNCVPKDLTFDIRTEKFFQERDKQLAKLTVGILRKGKKGLFVAGADHVYMLDQLYKKCWPKSTHLFLIPQETLSEESNSNSVKTLLVGDTQDTSVHPAKNVKTVSKKIPHGALNLDAQIKRLLAFNVKSLDSRLNHFAEWNERANRLLDLQEKTSTEKVKGFTPIPRPLPLGAHKEIYEYLDPGTKRMYPTICREFNTFKILDTRADRIEKFIRENYKILEETSSKADIKRFLFSLRGVAGSGEKHTEKWHDLLNATLANCLSEFGFTKFFIEGTQRDLEQWKNNKTYLFSYLKPKVAAAVKTWDLNIEEDQQAVKKYKESFLLVGRKVTFMQKLFRLYSDPQKWNLKDFNAFLLDAGTPEVARGFWDVLFPQVWSCYFPTIPPGEVSVMASHPKSKELVAEIVKIAAISLIRNCVPKDLPLDGKREKFFRERDKQFLTLTLDLLHKGEKGLFVAGAAHVYLLGQLYNKHWPKNTHLFLIPQETLKQESVSNSVKTLLVGDTQDTSVHPAKNVKTVSKKIPEGALNLDAQIKRLLAFNVKSLDAGLNHFGEWNQRANQLLDLQEKTSNETVGRSLA